MDTPFLSSILLFNVKMKNFSLQKYFLYSLRESSRFYMYISGAAVDPVLVSDFIRESSRYISGAAVDPVLVSDFIRESSRFYMYISGAAVDPVLISEQQLSVLTDYVSFLES
jgi:hypothetical protein